MPPACLIAYGCPLPNDSCKTVAALVLLYTLKVIRFKTSSVLIDAPQCRINHLSPIQLSSRSIHNALDNPGCLRKTLCVEVAIRDLLLDE